MRLHNTILLVDALNWEVTNNNLVNKVVCDPSNHDYMIHHCTNCPGANALRKFLELQESLKANEVTVLGDFAENYQFLVQKEIQRYQWGT